MTIPDSWAVRKFTDILDIQGGTQPPKSEFIFHPKDGYIRLLQIRDFGSKPIPTYIPDNGKRKTCKETDLLIGRYGASIGRICTGMSGAYNVALAKVIKPDYIEIEYLKYFLLSDNFQSPLSMLSRSAQNGFNKTDLSSFDFFYPEFDEQKKISSKLKSIFEKIDLAQSRLEKVPQLLKRFRMSVLSAAVAGELTEEWRDVNNADDWEYVSLKQVGKGFNYGSSAKSKKEGSVPVLRMGNLQDGKLDWSDLVYTSDEKEIEKYKLEAGDVLFNRTNSPELVGKTSIYRGEREAIFAGYLIKVQGTERLNSEYLNIQLNSPNARDYCWQVKTDGVSQSNINAQKLKAYEFNLPSIEEQEEIVRVVSELLAKSDLVKKQYEAAKLRVDKLTQSILARAFRGELFEPFSDKAERVAQPQSEDVIDEEPTDREETTLEQADINSIQSRPTPKTVDDKSELLSQLKSAKKAMTAQQLFDSASVETFKAIDELFVELKRLLELNLIEKMGEGENCQFKATK
ncbi:restriction endonuclease subunit S [Vibrio cholerae]|uniref:restriction endonuclease subunit S n=1 Tax=Vibrio cholerae TaxID=666 RepID=UPI000C71455E|nr:restriction endonuclease subunit S [Vibrio cholerae]SNC56450.1 Type I restriction enzyme EcoKI specificity protein [Vibrio cholerae]